MNQRSTPRPHLSGSARGVARRHTFKVACGEIESDIRFTRWALSSSSLSLSRRAYLFRVAQTRNRPSKQPTLPTVDPTSIPDVEPGLAPALMALPATQRTAVWLAHGCDWPHTEIADVLEVTPSTVATHIRRGLARLRTELGVSHADA